MKKVLKKILNLFGFKISRINSKNKNFDEIYKLFLDTEIIIFDVGANKGQSIERFKKIFPKCTIHAFEPIHYEYKNLVNKYSREKNIILNNFALGEKKHTKEINLAKRSGVSSFNEFNKNHMWIKTRSKEYNTDVENFLTGKETVKIDTIDNYCLENKVNKIDILKIDTQGYEDLVLAGAREVLKKNIISAVELELIFDDTYNKFLTFSDIEKYLNENYRFSGIKNYNNNLFEGINFFSEVLYINKKLINKILNK